MRALFVVDPLDTLDAGIDASVGLMAAVEADGGEVWVCGPEHLALVDGHLVVEAVRITLRPRTRRGDHRWEVSARWYDRAEQRDLGVSGSFSAVLMRLDPPVDPRYLRTTYLLDVAAAEGVPVLNRPAGVRALQEKLFPLRYPDLCPETIVSARTAEVLRFVEQHGAAVVKPVDGFGGADVWLLRHDDPNAVPLVESATALGTRHVVVQRYLTAVTNGNRRLFVLDGEIIGSVGRLPVGGRDFRIGAPSVLTEADARDEEIVRAISPDLAANGIVLAGLDVIDGLLIEVNVTCPGGMAKADALLGTDLSGAVVRRLLSPHHERIPR